MMEKLNYKKLFLRLLIIALSISAIIGVFIFLIGEFGDIQARLLLTTLTVGGYSLTGLCCATIQNNQKLKAFSNIGIITSLLGFIVTIIAIWGFIDIENIWKVMLIFITFSFVMAHSSLLLQIKSKSNLIKYLLICTIVCITIIALMLSKSILSEFSESEFYFRLLGVFAILDVLGTIAMPILNRITEKPNS